MRALHGCGIALASFVFASAAHSHPHAWIETRSDVVFDDEGRIGAINIEWTFDEGYSEMAIEGLDANGDGYLSAGELHPLARENLNALKDYDYFVKSRAGGEAVEYGDVSQFGMIFNDGRLTMYFTIPLVRPFDPFAGDFVYRVYDPSFYIAIDFAEDSPLALLGRAPAACAIELRPAPTGAEIDDTRSMLARQGTDWQPAEEDDFGAMFAQPVAVVCTKKTS